jgi:hypothetical protein
MRTCAGIVVALAISLFLGTGAPCAPAQTPPKVASSMKLIQVLNEELIEVKNFTTPLTLLDMLGLLYEQMAAKGHEVTILVDVAAFRSGCTEPTDPYEAHVYLPSLPRKMPLEMALRLVLSKIPNATFIVRDGLVWITTEKEASVEQLLKQKILAQYTKRPLREIVQEIEERTGVSIIIDPRLENRGNPELTATLRNAATAKGALEMLARMAGLKAEFHSYGVFITEP